MVYLLLSKFLKKSILKLLKIFIELVLKENIKDEEKWITKNRNPMNETIWQYIVQQSAFRSYLFQNINKNL